MTPDTPEELTDAVVGGFAEHGCDVDLISPQDDWDFRPHDFLLCYGPMRSIVRGVERLKAMPHVPPVIVWFTEQTPSPRWPAALLRPAAQARYALESRFAPQIGSKAGRLRALGELLALQQSGRLVRAFTFTETNRRALNRLGLPATVVPMGYGPMFGQDLGLERDVDVVFLGSARDSRRGPMLRRLERQLAACGVRFVIKDGSPERGHVFGQERTRLLNRAKIMLNLMRQPWDDPVFRILLAAPNGAMLLSEALLPASRGPYRAGEHFAMAADGDVAGAVRHYLARDVERRRIAEAARDFVTTDQTMGRMAGRILQTLP
ncbi:MAG: glycosyltransferase [Armatimonadetes bacterium]|nr:glycosyltransferase [Armatimonadota bacterium]